MKQSQESAPGGMQVPVALRHSTRYRYDRPVALGPHDIRLRPVPGCRTPVASYSLTVRPAAQDLRWRLDAPGNPVARALFPVKTEQLDIDVDLVADLAPVNAFDFLVEPSAEHFPFQYPEIEHADLSAFLAPAESDALLVRWLDGFRTSSPRTTVDLLAALNRFVKNDIAYVTRMEHGVQTCEDTLKRRSGSCRDSGWLLVQALRHLGIAARFVSGYLVQLAGTGAGAPETDRLDLHAWADAYLPGAGWIGLDPTSGLLAAEGHIPLARAAAFALAAPVTGSVEPCRSTLNVSMTVQRL